MSHAHMVIEGDFVHAELYFGVLVAVAYSGEIHRYRVPSLQSRVPPTSEQLAQFRDASHGLSGLPIAGTEIGRPPSNAEVRTLHSYNGVTLFGAEDGLWQAPTAGGRSTQAPEYERLLKRSTLDIDTTFGVAALAHGDGISVIPLASSWLSSYFASSRDQSEDPAETVRWSFHDLLSRTSPTSHRLVRADFELRERENETHYVFRRLEPSVPVKPLNRRVSAVGTRSFASFEGLDSSVIFAKKGRGWARGSSGKAESSSESSFKMIGTLPGRVIALYELSESFICEMTDRIVVLGPDGEHSVLLDMPATGIKTYPRSRRYRGIVTAIAENGIHVLDPAIPGSSIRSVRERALENPNVYR